MIFEWDEGKSRANSLKHGINFEMAKGLWLDENRIEIHAPHPIENRWITIAELNGKIWVAVHTRRKERIRLTKEFISNAPSPLPSPSRGEGYNITPPLRGGDEGEGDVCGFTNSRISISVRRARRKEKILYEKEKTG